MAESGAYFGEEERLRQKNLKELKYYLKLHKKYPRKKYFVPLAEMYRSLEYLDEAVQILQEGLKWHPGYFIGRAVLARTYYEMGYTLQASLEAKRVVHMDPKNLLGWRVLMKAYLKLGEVKNARETAQRLLKMIPSDEEALKIASSLEDAHHFKGAESPRGHIENFEVRHFPLQKNKGTDKKIDLLHKLLIKIQSKRIQSRNYYETQEQSS